MFPGSCADIMHSAQPFRDGFKENVIGVILRDVIQGLEYLHSLGYVHRLDQNPLQKDPFPPDLAHLIMCVFSSMAELFIV